MQAAAEGLSKFRVGKEERKPGNKAREDVRGYVSDPFTDQYEFALPQEVKKDYRLASTQDPDGVHSNYLGLGKVLLRLFLSTAGSRIQVLTCVFFLSSRNSHAPMR